MKRKVTTAWLFGIGFKLGMSVNEIRNTLPGEMLDYASCYAIANGAEEAYIYTFDEIMEMH